jgi:hypothetical protein
METQTAPTYRIWGTDNIAYGPVELPGLVAWVRQGRMRPDSWVYRDEQRDWMRASSLPELGAILKPKGGAPAPPSPSALKPEQLRRIKILAEMGHAQLASLLSYLELVEVPKFATLFHKGDAGDAMYSILEGEMRAREVRGGREVTILTLGVGETFGEMALLIEGERASDIVANEQSKLLKLPAQAFVRITQEAPALATPFLLAISRMLAHRARVLGGRAAGDAVIIQAASGIAPEPQDT